MSFFLSFFNRYKSQGHYSQMPQRCPCASVTNGQSFFACIYEATTYSKASTEKLNEQKRQGVGRAHAPLALTTFDLHKPLGDPAIHNRACSFYSAELNPKVSQNKAQTARQHSPRTANNARRKKNENQPTLCSVCTNFS